MKKIGVDSLKHQDKFLVYALEAVSQAGVLLASGFGLSAKVERDKGRDIKATADIEADQCIRKVLAPTGLPILSEEDYTSFDSGTQGLRWIVDPLDGTMNYTRGVPACCTSVALWEDDQPVLGVIYDFMHDDKYVGLASKDIASLNGEPIHVSSVDRTNKAVLATGFPTGMAYDENSLRQYVRQLQSVKKKRLIGSAALSLALVAAGSFEAYMEDSIWLWDVAAGLALVKAAGGDISWDLPNADWQTNVVATNGRINLIDG